MTELLTAEEILRLAAESHDVLTPIIDQIVNGYGLGWLVLPPRYFHSIINGGSYHARRKCRKCRGCFFFEMGRKVYCKKCAVVQATRVPNSLGILSTNWLYA